MSKKTVFTITAVLAVVVSCGTKEVKKQADTEFARDKTLYIAGFQWGDPNSFNPLIDWPAWPIGEYFNLVYEPLMMWNTLTGKMEPLLARSCENMGNVVSTVMDPKARWSDGTPLTAADVKYTFDIGSIYPSAPTAFVWNYVDGVTIDTVTDSSGTFERVNFAVGRSRNNPLAVLDFLQSIRIVPEHFFARLIDSLGGDFSAMQKEKIDKNPVVSGPYNLFTYSNEKIVLKRRDDYWGNAALYGGRKALPGYVIHPIYKSNDHISIGLQQGGIDVSGSFIPRIWMKRTQQVETWYDTVPYFVPASITMLFINCSKYPLSDKRLRRAMAYAINYNDINELAISGYSPPLKQGLILPFGSEAHYFSDEDAKKNGTTYDPELAGKILKEAGYRSEFDQSGNLVAMKDPKGKRVETMYITSPAGWTDWETAIKIAVRDMRAVGIDVREGFSDAGTYFQRMPMGNFDLIMRTPSPSPTPSKPWSRFESTISSRNWKPCGEKMNENQGRFNQPGAKGYIAEIDSLLTALPAMTDEKAVTAAYRRLNVLFMQEQPTIPVFYRPEQFYEFSTKNWTNFPKESNPYATPQCLCFGPSIRAFWEITPVKGK